MSSPAPKIALFARYPVAGMAKTRLIPALGEQGAADLHRTLVERTIATMRESGLPFALHITGAPASDFAEWLGDDVELVEQGDGDLGDRLSRVSAPAILLGADIPDLEAHHLIAAAKALEEFPVAIGPVNDGGYYCLGFREPVPFLLEDMDWGTDGVAAETMARLKARDIPFCVLDKLRDCDRPEDLENWPDLAGKSPATTTVLVPMLNEEKALPQVIAHLAALDPQPHEILAVDGGSEDGSALLAKEAGWRVITAPRGRGSQINAGVKAARGTQVVVLHADTIPPSDFIAVIDETLADPKIALAGFTPIIRGPEKTRWGTTAHNWAKTWYAPLLARPHLFFKGVRLLFGDHAMFFRRGDFLAVGGCDPEAKVMEEADLCIAMVAKGRVKLIRRTVQTSDRRVAEWGPLKANWIYMKVGIMWALGARSRLEEQYPDVR